MVMHLKCHRHHRCHLFDDDSLLLTLGHIVDVLAANHKTYFLL